MLNFKPVTRPSDVDFFTIRTDKNGVKQIKLWGYTYESSDKEWESEENPDGIYWANMECCGLELPLEEFLSDDCDIDNLYCEATQYQGDYSEKDIVDVINHYYQRIVFSVDYPSKNDGNPDAYLDFGELTMDTPDGDYVTVPDEYLPEQIEKLGIK